MPKNHRKKWRPNAKTTLIASQSVMKTEYRSKGQKDQAVQIFRELNAVEIRMIPHHHHRYETPGDWWVAQDGTLQVRASKFPTRSDGWKFSMCIAVHELVEALLCIARDIPEQVVDEFDTGVGADLDEPGDDPRAPYHREHLAASVPEVALLSELGISLTAYTEALNQLPEWKTPRPRSS